MHEHLASLAEAAALHHGVVTVEQIHLAGISVSTRRRWLASGLLVRRGVRSFTLGGAPATWQQRLAAVVVDLDGRGFLAGRTAACLHGLDGFSPSNDVEVLAPRARRGISVDARLATTGLQLDAGSTTVAGGFRCLTAERLILDSPLFAFATAEIENAIDSAIRLRLVGEQRLRTNVIRRHTRGINGGRGLLDALVDTGGESRLERWMLRLVREAGLPQPRLQRTFRDGCRIIARVDMQFGDDLIVEVSGHGTHSSRRQLQADEQRRTELVGRGHRVVVFRYEDIRDRPAWVIAQLRALTSVASSAA